jgi:hypothetical protein
MATTYEQAFASWTADIKPLVIDQYGEDDEVALSESWNDYTDSLCKEGEFSDLQYHHCPAWDDSMPDSDQAYILEALGVAMSSIKLASRPDKLDENFSADSTHWKVLIKRGKNEFETFYSMGSAYTTSPDIEDVMYSLLSDTSNVDGYSFEEWASDLGMDTDSRKAEKMFKACQDTLLQLRLLFTEKELDDLREVYQDF